MSHSHLAIICESAGGSGSVARVARRQARELSRYFKVSLFSNILPLRGLPGVDFVLVDAPRFDFLRRYCHVPNHLGFVFRARRRLADVHRKQPIHAIICHSHAIAALAAQQFGRPRGIPYALVTHGDIFDVPPGSYDARLTWFYKAVHPPAYRGAALVIALSPHMADCAKAGGAVAARVRILPNGIDLADIGMDEAASECSLLRAQNGLLKLLFVGRLAKEKGVDVLLRAARLLADKGIEFSLRIVGDGAEADFDKSLCTSLGLGRYVTFAGAIPGRELGKEYEAADIVCVPSLGDPLPTVVLEAMGMGRPVIGSNVGGIPFMINDRDTGILVQPGSAEDLAQEIAALGLNRTLLRQMGERAALSVRTRFSWSKIGAKLAALIEETMACKRKSNTSAIG